MERLIPIIAPVPKRPSPSFLSLSTPAMMVPSVSAPPYISEIVTVGGEDAGFEVTVDGPTSECAEAEDAEGFDVIADGGATAEGAGVGVARSEGEIVVPGRGTSVVVDGTGTDSAST
jgi:hypothetical protein